MSSFRKGQTVTVRSAPYLSTKLRAPKEAQVARVTRGEVHLVGWEFPFDAVTGRQVISPGYDKPLTYTAWIEF